MDAEECQDEQRDEMEAMEAIFADEYEQVSTVDDGNPEFRLQLVPLPGEDEENHGPCHRPRRRPVGERGTAHGASYR